MRLNTQLVHRNRYAQARSRHQSKTPCRSPFRGERRRRVSQIRYADRSPIHAVKMDLEPYKPPVYFEHESDESSRNVICVPLRKLTFVATICFTALFYVGFLGATHLLALARPFRHRLIAGLSCTRGWREAVHEISCIASLYPHFLAVCVVLGFLRVPRTWLGGTAAIAFGFTAYLVWTASMGSLPGGIESVTHPPGAMRVVAATLHGLSHVFLIPIGFRIGEHLRQRTRPRIRRGDCVVIALLLVIWAFASIETNTPFQHTSIRWLTFATLIFFAGRSTLKWWELIWQGENCSYRSNGNAGTIACTRVRESGGLEVDTLSRTR